MFSEVSKFQKAISVKEAQAANWHAQVTSIEAEKLALISQLETAMQVAEKAQAELVTAVAEVQFESERELEQAIAEALAERMALEKSKEELAAAMAQTKVDAERELERAIADALSERQAMELLMKDKEEAWKVEMLSLIHI